MYELILASKSPRRRELLLELGYPVIFADILVDEHLEGEYAPEAVAEAIARKKASAFDAETLRNNQILVTADTVVICNNQVMGKPHNREEAISALKLLSNQWHNVCSGVCLVSRNAQKSFTETTRVHFKTLSDEEVLHYVEKFEPYDKAGSYGIQEWIGLIGIDRIEGCYYNVMGLPTSRLYQELQSLGQ